MDIDIFLDPYTLGLSIQYVDGRDEPDMPGDHCIGIMIAFIQIQIIWGDRLDE